MRYGNLSQLAPLIPEGTCIAVPNVLYSRDGECIWRRPTRAHRAGIPTRRRDVCPKWQPRSIDPRTLQRWIAHERATGSLVPKPKAGGWRCPIDLALLHAVIAAAPDATVAELGWAYNQQARAGARTTDTSFRRAMHREGYVLKKNGRGRARSIGRTSRRSARPFLRWMRRVDPERLVFIDEAGANLAMGRSHAWVLRGREYVEPRSMNWGDNLTLVGAIRRQGWVALGTCWRAMNAKAFLRWVRGVLVPRLWRGAIVVLDNLGAHKQAAVRTAIERVGPP
jgi:DDE superfamily endonuclease